MLKLIVEFVRMLFINKRSKHRFRCILVNKFSLTSKQNYQMQFLLAGSGIDFIATERLQLLGTSESRVNFVLRRAVGSRSCKSRRARKSVVFVDTLLLLGTNFIS